LKKNLLAAEEEKILTKEQYKTIFSHLFGIRDVSRTVFEFLDAAFVAERETGSPVKLGYILLENVYHSLQREFLHLNYILSIHSSRCKSLTNMREYACIMKL